MLFRRIRNKGGRFLRKLDAKEAKKAGVPDEVDAWVCVDEKTIMEKAKQALRQKGEAKGQDKDASPLREAQVASAAGISDDMPPPDLHQGAPESLLDYEDQGHPGGASDTTGFVHFGRATAGAIKSRNRLSGAPTRTIGDNLSQNICRPRIFNRINFYTLRINKGKDFSRRNHLRFNGIPI